MDDNVAAMSRVGSTQLDHRGRLIILGATLLGLFLTALDQTIVGTAMPNIVTDLHGNNIYTWVVTAYLLTSTVTVPIYGKLSDVYGRKRLLLIGITIFLVGSALSGLSQNMGQLIAFRAVQGLGGGAMFPISLAVIGDLFSPRERSRYQGLFGAVFGVSFLIGPFLGGVITDNVGWNWVFYVNLPIGIVTMAVIGLVLPNMRTVAAKARDLDYLGIALFVIGVVPILIGLTNKGLTDAHGRLNDWTSFPVGCLLAFGVVAIVAFLVVERSATQPIVPLDLFFNLTYAGATLATFLIGFGMFTAVIFVPRYFQVVHGDSATASGYRMWPLLVGLIGGSIGSGIIISRIGRYKAILVGAMGLFCIGALAMTQLEAKTSDTVFWLWMFVFGIGIGPALSGFTVVVQNVVPRERLGVAISTLAFLRQIGGSMGLAIAGTRFSAAFSDQLPHQLTVAGVPSALASRFTQVATHNQLDLTSVGNLGAVLAHSLPGQLRFAIPAIVNGLHGAFAVAMGSAFWPTVVAALGALAATAVIQAGFLHVQVSQAATGGKVGLADLPVAKPTSVPLPGTRAPARAPAGARAPAPTSVPAPLHAATQPVLQMGISSVVQLTMPHFIVLRPVTQSVNGHQTSNGLETPNGYEANGYQANGHQASWPVAAPGKTPSDRQKLLLWNAIRTRFEMELALTRQHRPTWIDVAELDALVRLVDHGGPISLRQLGTATGRSLPDAVRLSDGLLWHGLLHCTADDSDVDGFSLSVTPEAERLAASYRADRHESIQTVLHDDRLLHRVVSQADADPIWRTSSMARDPADSQPVPTGPTRTHNEFQPDQVVQHAGRVSQ